jgi:ABC-type transport system involved in cytochrome c biogenesis ATPase subunit
VKPKKRYYCCNGSEIISGTAYMFVAGSNGTGRDACVRLVGGLVISSHCTTFP